MDMLDYAVCDEGMREPRVAAVYRHIAVGDMLKIDAGPLWEVTVLEQGQGADMARARCGQRVVTWRVTGKEYIRWHNQTVDGVPHVLYLGQPYPKG